MLRCPPSRISLAASDIAQHDARMAIRRHVRSSNEMQNSRLRFSPGARRSPILDIVTAENNRANQRAASCCSEATICSTEDEEGDKTLVQADARLVVPITITVDAALPTSSNSCVPRISIGEDGVLLPSSEEGLNNARGASVTVKQEIETQEVTAPALSLDPGAPAFVPRTTFGSSTHLSADHDTSIEKPDRRHHGHDNTMVPAHLRMRSSFERNTDQPGDALDRPDRDDPARHQRRPRRTGNEFSMTSDEEVPFTLPNLDRYPPLRVPRPMVSRRRSRSRRPVVFPQRRGSQQRIASMGGTESTGHTTTETSRPSERTSHRLSVARAPSSSSRSTPNLLRSPAGRGGTNARSSSLSWKNRESPRQSQRRRIMASETPGAPEADQKRSTPPDSFDSGTAELILRQSPLDELSEAISRLSAGRPRSNGSSRHRSKARISLLSGDLFQDRPTQRHDIKREESVLSIAPQDERLALSVALTAAESPSSPSASKTPSSLPNASPSQLSILDTPSPQPTPLPNLATATPKLPIYNDTRSPTTQPQTPADLPSRHRTHVRTHTTWRAQATSATAIPTAGHRHTVSAQPAPTTNLSPLRGGPHEVSRHSHESAARYGRVHRTAAVENDLGHSLEGVLGEAEQRLLLGQPSGGGLEVTPPREGRFERFVVT